MFRVSHAVKGVLAALVAAVALADLVAASEPIGLPALELVSTFGIELPAPQTTLNGLSDSADNQVGTSGFASSVAAPGYKLYLPMVRTPPDWPMAGANPQRTGWSPETLPGNIRTAWVKPIVPYISQHVQVVGAAGKVYVSTAAGLYAFDANNGADVW